MRKKSLLEFELKPELDNITYEVRNWRTNETGVRTATEVLKEILPQCFREPQAEFCYLEFQGRVYEGASSKGKRSVWNRLSGLLQSIACSPLMNIPGSVRHKVYEILGPELRIVKVSANEVKWISLYDYYKAKEAKKTPIFITEEVSK